MIPVLGWTQQDDLFSSLINSAPGYQSDQAITRLKAFEDRIQQKREKFKSDKLFLRYTFEETHKTFLTNYRAYSQFPEVFENGDYDCLSATSLFSVLLDDLGFSYKIIETNYHIFLMVELGPQSILLETTDRFNGFVTSERAIKERLNSYQIQNKTFPVKAEGGKHYFQYHLDLYQEIEPEQLTGLFYYNQAITAFNTNNLQVSVRCLMKSMKIYNSPRIAEFAVILVNKIAESDLDQGQKRSLISPFASLIKAKAELVASR